MRPENQKPVQARPSTRINQIREDGYFKEDVHVNVLICTLKIRTKAARVKAAWAFQFWNAAETSSMRINECRKNCCYSTAYSFFCTAALQPQEMLLMDQLCRTISLRIEQTSGIITMLFANSSGEAQRKR
mmetsp:Transcript_97416/g.163748  ORF Transcript_97416/g.163748 Transcript_97416/m.163748 type:complete len:130 (-) Transcript_97416:1683-2072(-)